MVTFVEKIYGYEIKTYSCREEIKIKQFRNEWKYCCSESTLAMIARRLDEILDVDKNGDLRGNYEIHSLYFDDIKNICVKENEAGISERFKYRIRYYGNNPDYLKLERKVKFNGRCYKDSCIITLSEYEKVMSGNVGELYWETDKPVLKRFCVYCMAKGFSPKAIVDYERCAFVEETSNVRITIDRNISVSGETEAFFTGNYLRIPIQEKHQHILEVKFDNILPSYIRHLVTCYETAQTTFSKYYLGRQQLQRYEGFLC